MSTYEIGAFEALEWAWNVLRTQESIGEVDATSRIKDMQIDFKQQINEIRSLA